MQIALALYPYFTLLDIIGPFQVGRGTLIATKSFTDVAEPDIVVVPGGLGETELQPELIEWLRAVHATTTWTTSVCTGAIYLAAAGILDGLDATTHWARKNALEQLGAHYTAERVVERGKVVTAAGVSSGIDMALVLLDRMYGPEAPQMVQLAIEYDPQPPFDAGSPAKAPAALVQQTIGEGPALPATTTGDAR